MGCLDQLHLQQTLEDYSDLHHPLQLIPQGASLVDQNQHSQILLGDCLERHNSQTLHLLVVDYLDKTHLQEAAYLDRLPSLQPVVFLDKQHNPTKGLLEDYLDSLLHHNQEAFLDKQQPLNQHLVSLDNHNNQVCLDSK